MSESVQAALKLYLRLTPREREVANLIADGLSNRAIAKHMDIKRGVVANMLGRIYVKMDYQVYDGSNVRVLLANAVNLVRQNALG
jgi:DNA-binding CsgD family transcriptional regulator